MNMVISLVFLAATLAWSWVFVWLGHVVTVSVRWKGALNAWESCVIVFFFALLLAEGLILTYCSGFFWRLA